MLEELLFVAEKEMDGLKGNKMVGSCVVEKISNKITERERERERERCRAYYGQINRIQRSCGRLALGHTQHLHCD